MGKISVGVRVHEIKRPPRPPAIHRFCIRFFGLVFHLSASTLRPVFTRPKDRLRESLTIPPSWFDSARTTVFGSGQILLRTSNHGQLLSISRLVYRPSR